jgi:hypothetical protein
MYSTLLPLRPLTWAQQIMYLWGSAEHRKAACIELALQFGSVVSLSILKGDYSKDDQPIVIPVSLPKKHDDRWATLHSTMNQEQAKKLKVKELAKEKEEFVSARVDHDAADFQVRCNT